MKEMNKSDVLINLVSQLVMFAFQFICIIVFNRMLNQVPFPLAPLFDQQGLTHLAYKIITYIDIQTLSQVISWGQSSSLNHKQTQQIAKNLPSSKKPTPMNQMIKTHYFLTQYLNKADRSMYYSFYEQPEFIELQKQFIQQIVITQTINADQKYKFPVLLEAFTRILKTIQSQSIMNEDQTQELQRIFLDPSLPLPNLKRQNEGLYCNSSFQLFLVGLRFSHNQDQAKQDYSLFQELKQKVLSEQENYLKSFMQVQKEKHSDPLKYQNLHLVRYTPYEIGFKNYESLLLKQHELHNLIVKIFVLTDILIQSLSNLINLIPDPFYKFIEMMSHYSIFRSFVMEIEESIGFLFHTYDSLYSDTIRDSILQSNNKPKYCFWRPAMTKWFIKMSPIHNQTNQVYFLLLTKMREQNLFNCLLEGGQKAKDWNLIKKYEICFKNNIELADFSSYINTRVYKNFHGETLMGDYVQSSLETCEALVFQYEEYMIDLTINEETVHWCGHSKQRLETPFTLFNQQFKQYNRAYFQHIKNSLPAFLLQPPHYQKMKPVLQLLLQEEINFLDLKNVKPFTLREIVEQINLDGKFFNNCCAQWQSSETHIQEKMDKKSLQKTPSQSKQDSKQINKQIFVFYDFSEKDQKLKYFNNKAKICESIQGEEKCFFSIPPLLSAYEILIKSIDTSDDSDQNENSQNSSYEYVSDSEDILSVDLCSKQNLCLNQSSCLNQNLCLSQSLKQLKKDNTTYEEMMTSTTSHQDTLRFQVKQQKAQFKQGYNNQKSQKLSFQSEGVDIYLELDQEQQDLLTLKKKLSSSCKNKSTCKDNSPCKNSNF